ncbi:rubredoxin-like domain-containing protein [Desulfopila sp. IMCC35006]|uniref:rubredoxin-like domain-containing protein n=1 Tax=Desulfopila sp. IMCC35006 TaxID=2569542 RepID=UPI003519F5E4
MQRIILADFLLKEYQPSLPLHRLHDPSSGKTATSTGKVWRGRICGYVHYADTAPAECPCCFFPIRHLNECNILDAETYIRM